MACGPTGRRPLRSRTLAAHTHRPLLDPADETIATIDRLVAAHLSPPQVTVQLLRELTAGPTATDTAADPDQGAEPLTEREREIVALLAGGSTNAEIAAQLFIATGTVKNHLASVQRKLWTRNRVGIAAWAWEHGLCRS